MPHQSIQLEHLLLLLMYTVLNDCKVNVMVYTYNARLGLLGWFYDTLQLQCHAYYQYQLQLSYVTGFWKTDQIIALGLFHFIGQTNGYTRTLHIHSVSIRLD